MTIKRGVFMIRVVLLLLFCCCTLFSEGRDKKSSASEIGPVAREKERRAKLTKKWHKGELNNDQFFSKVYAPTVVGCKKGISDSKKLILKLKSKLKKAKSKGLRAKYSKGVELYSEYLKLLESAVSAIVEEKNYNKLCSEIFPAIKEQEKKIARVSGSGVRRDWLMTSELFPTSTKKKKSSSDDDKKEKSKSKKSN